MPSPIVPRAKRQTAAQRRRNQFEEAVYLAMRSYQRGEYAGTSGVVVGQLDVPLSTLFDAVAKAAKDAFK